MRTKLDSIQVLRAFAALSVVFFHTGYRFGSWKILGSFGVDIFFVISGFIMAMICVSESSYFLRKRLIRILPLYWALTFIVFATLTLHPRIDPSLERGPAILLKSLLFIPYLRSDRSVYPLLVVGWTLNYEICFYLILALALFLTRERAAILTAILLLLFMSTMQLAPQAVFPVFFGKAIMLEFIAGMVAYRVYVHVTAAQCASLRPLFFVTIPIAAAALVLVQAYDFERIPRVISLGVPAFLLTQSVVLLSKSGLDARWRLPVLLGDASYSLYLTHVFVISAFKRVVATHAAWLSLDHPAGMLAALLISCAVALAVHVFIDRPTYRYLNRRFIRKQTV